MISIQNTSNSVKSNKSKKEKKSRIDSLLKFLAEKDPNYSDTIHTYTDPHSGHEYTQWRHPDHECYSRCPHGVYYELRYMLDDWHRQAPMANVPAALTPELWAAMEDGIIPDAVAQEAVVKHIRHAPIVMTRLEDGDYYFFRAPVRGDKHYAKRVQKRISACMDDIATSNGTTLFVTCTYAIGRYSRDIYSAWKRAAGGLLKLKRELRRRYKILFVDVIESTNRGYPHVHLVLHFPGASFPSFFHNEKWRLGDETLRQYIKTSWGLGHVDISVVQAKNKDELNDLLGYVGKYITKGFSLKEIKEEEVNEKKRKKKRMEILTNILPVACGIRGWHASRRLGRSVRVTDTKSKKESTPYDDKENIDWQRKSKSDLKSILTNLTVGCQAHTWMIARETDKAKVEDHIGVAARSNADAVRYCVMMGRVMGCVGCILTDALADMMSQTTDSGFGFWDSA